MKKRRRVVCVEGIGGIEIVPNSVPGQKVAVVGSSCGDEGDAIPGVEGSVIGGLAVEVEQNVLGDSGAGAEGIVEIDRRPRAVEGDVAAEIDGRGHGLEIQGALLVQDPDLVAVVTQDFSSPGLQRLRKKRGQVTSEVTSDMRYTWQYR